MERSIKGDPLWINHNRMADGCKLSADGVTHGLVRMRRCAVISAARTCCRGTGRGREETRNLIARVTEPAHLGVIALFR